MALLFFFDLFFYNDVSEKSVALKFFTDTAPSVGFGGSYKDEWFADVWPEELLDLLSDLQSTTLLELYPIVAACILWGKLWSCDNEATVNIINKRCSFTPFIHRFMRRLTWSCVMGNFTLHAAHAPGLDNKTADSLS